MTEFDGFLQEYEQHLDDPEWLSRAIVILSSQLFTHNTKMAIAELEETRTMVDYLSIQTDRKVTVSEAERRAQVDTNNHYSEMKSQAEAIVEVIQSIKKRIEVLMSEYKLTK